MIAPMIVKVVNLFKRYANRHAYAQKAGFPLLNSDGERIGHIDHITVRGGRICVEGWALSNLVGVANREQVVEHVPNLARDDVLNALGEISFRKPGFLLEFPFSQCLTMLWVDIMGTRYMYSLPKFSVRDMQRSQIVPFLRDAAKAFPAGLHWLWLCCTNRVRDSSRESSVVAVMHEQTHTHDLQDQELASLQ